MNAQLLLATLAFLSTAGQANAQDSAPSAAAVPAVAAVAPATATDSLAAAIGTHYLDNNIRGFGRAEILGPDGKTHFVYIPIQPNGFKGYLPFHRHEEDLKRFGREPFSIDVDKVQSLKINGLYQEHIVLKGKRKRILATRLANGPVELFNYTEIVQTAAAMAPAVGVVGGMAMGATGLGGFPNRTWYLRRQGGELVEVSRMSFSSQMTAYFQDAPEIVAALGAGKLHYRDMVALVQGYNEYRTRPVITPAAGGK